MSFWEKFKRLVPLRHVVFLLVLFAVTIVIFYFDSAEDIKVSFSDEAVDIKAASYQMNIPYEMIDSLELTDMPDGGEEIDGSDNMVTRLGHWKNDTWGEYYACADLDTTQCIVARLTDGRVFVFSRKDDQQTAEIYQTLLTYLDAEAAPAA